LEKLDHLSEQDQNTGKVLPARGRFYQKLGAFVGIAASLFIALFIGSQQLLNDGESYSTGAGEQRLIYLDDGSKVHLNTRSQATVYHSDKLRKVVLNRGEALFDVAHEANRPFLVFTNGKTVKVIGTRFNIRSVNKETTVTVVKGVVAVGESLEKINVIDNNGATQARSLPTSKRPLKPSADTSEFVRLYAGEQVVYSLAGDLEEIEAVDPDNITAWQKGRLVYDKTPLNQVVQWRGEAQRPLT
jgi:transmembrane sensor